MSESEQLDQPRSDLPEVFTAAQEKRILELFTDWYLGGFKNPHSEVDDEQ